jgi:hypothetical protein
LISVAEGPWQNMLRTTGIGGDQASTFSSYIAASAGRTPTINQEVPRSDIEHTSSLRQVGVVDENENRVAAGSKH